MTRDAPYYVNGYMTADPRAYVRVAVWLLAQIEYGALKPGDPVPSADEIAARYGVSRQTCAKGLRMLERDGVLFRVPGHRYHVVPDQS